MNYTQYAKKFSDRSCAEGKDQGYIDRCLAYAKPLMERGLPVIYDVQHFSLLVGLRLEYLYSMAYAQYRFYRGFTIPKKNGKNRRIYEPLPMLKGVQHFILHSILEKTPCHPCSKAYRQDSSIKGNARFHRAQPVLIKLDLKNYFPSLHVSQVYNLFYKNFGYSKSLSALMARLCTLKEVLPQGAPTSPYLSNLLTTDLDKDIFSFCQSNGSLRYTRYADDIAISGNCDPTVIIPAVTRIVKAHSLELNTNKTTVLKPSRRQVVTGVVVNQKLQAPKDYRRAIRLELYYCKKYGIEEHLNHQIAYKGKIAPLSYCQIMLGRINYCLHLNSVDHEMQTYKTWLLGKMCEYDRS